MHTWSIWGSFQISWTWGLTSYLSTLSLIRELNVCEKPGKNKPCTHCFSVPILEVMPIQEIRRGSLVEFSPKNFVRYLKWREFPVPDIFGYFGDKISQKTEAVSIHPGSQRPLKKWSPGFVDEINPYLHNGLFQKTIYLMVFGPPGYSWYTDSSISGTWIFVGGKLHPKKQKAQLRCLASSRWFEPA